MRTPAAWHGSASRGCRGAGKSPQQNQTLRRDGWMDGQPSPVGVWLGPLTLLPRPSNISPLYFAINNRHNPSPRLSYAPVFQNELLKFQQGSCAPKPHRSPGISHTTELPSPSTLHGSVEHQRPPAVTVLSCLPQLSSPNRLRCVAWGEASKPRES